ncbi:MAG: anthranilate phosphoribosyltransferase [Candidatus Omnitrophota bacterium]
MIKEAIAKLVDKQDLTAKDMEAVFTEIMSGNATPSQISAFIVALRLKKETITEITAAAKVMRRFATGVTPKAKKIVDTCGTGGDGSGTFNVSTITAIVLAAGGAHVAKHGNRSVSSSCGSADLLEALGVNINADVRIMEKCIDEVGIGFLFAPSLHQAMKYAMPSRREIGIRTIFNILGPLTNPANATHQILGVFSLDLVEPLAGVLLNLGLKHAMVVHGEDGLDEVTLAGKTRICELKDNCLNTYDIKPDDFGFKKTGINELKGSDAKTNAQIAKDILNGAKGPKRDFVVLNAGCALYVADITPTINDGIKLAEQLLDTGKVLDVLEKFIFASQKTKTVDPRASYRE